MWNIYIKYIYFFMVGRVRGPAGTEPAIGVGNPGAVCTLRRTGVGAGSGRQSPKETTCGVGLHQPSVLKGPVGGFCFHFVWFFFLKSNSSQTSTFVKYNKKLLEKNEIWKHTHNTSPSFFFIRFNRYKISVTLLWKCINSYSPFLFLSHHVAKTALQGGSQRS